MRRYLLLLCAVAISAILCVPVARVLRRPAPEAKVLRIGVLGTMTGPAAMWGLVNKHCAEITAEMYNERGGIEIGGERYRIEVLCVDDKMDPKLAVKGAEQLLAEGVKYVIGPNVDSTSRSVGPVFESAGALNISYAFDRELYTPPRDNCVLGMVASYQLTPIMLKYLKENRGVRSVAFFSVSDPEWVQMRYIAVEEARRLGLEPVTFAQFDVSEETYSPDGAGYRNILRQFVERSPDALILLGCPPSDTPRIFRDAREMGYAGLVASHNSQELSLLRQVAGANAEGFLMMIGAGSSADRSEFLDQFIQLYRQRNGAWHDSAGTKVYALVAILATLQKAGPQAVNDVRAFKTAMETFEIDDPFVNKPRKLRYVGIQSFGQRRQIGVPLILGEVRREGISPVFTGSFE